MLDSCPNKLFSFFLLSLFISPFLISASPHDQEPKTQTNPFTRTSRILLELEENADHLPTTKKPSKNNQTNPIKTKIPSSSKNQTKLIKTTTNNTPSSSKNQTKPLKIKTPSSSKNQTTPLKLKTPSSSKNQTTPLKLKTPSSPKNQTTPIKLKTPSSSKNQTKSIKLKTPSSIKTQSDLPKNNLEKKPTSTDDGDDDEYDDLVSGFRDLPLKFQETIVPDLNKISKTSQVYLNRYNREITRGFKPYVGSKYAPAFASYSLFAFILIPLIIVSLIFNKIKTYFSIQKLLIFIQIYLAIYFSILGLSSLVTGLEPLRFFYSTSRSTYMCVQVLQTLGYVMYLLLLVMYLVLVFSTETGLPAKMLGLAQTIVGFAIGLHYYMTVFHRAVLHQPPKSSWKAHGLYATCFAVICVLGGAETRKKAYLEEGGEEGKKS